MQAADLGKAVYLKRRHGMAIQYKLFDLYTNWNPPFDVPAWNARQGCELIGSCLWLHPSECSK